MKLTNAPEIEYPMLSGTMTAWLMTKPRPRIVGRVCQQEDFVCKRPQWGDGRVNGDWHGLCSMCWHAWNAWHGNYVTFKANPASLLNASNVNRLRFLGPELPDHVDGPTFLPEDWS